MPSNGKLHELRVAIRVALGGYKKDMEAVKAETKKIREAVSGETSKINAAMNQVKTQKARQEVERLTSQLEKQKERILQQENVIRRLKSQYDDLVSGVSKDRSISGLEKQLKSAEKEFDTVQKKLFGLYDQFEIVESAFKTGGASTSQMQTLQSEIDELEPKYESLGRKVQMLADKLQQVQMNPQTSSQAQDLAARLEVETKKLERMKNEAGTVKEKLDAILHSKSPPGTSSKLSQIISRIKELAKNARKSSAEMTSGFNRMETAISRVKRRITSLVGSVLVFEVLRRALVAVKDTLNGCLKTNQEFTNSLNIIKSNLYVTFASVYTAVLPAINALMSALAAVTGALARIVSGIFGRTYAESLQTAKGLKNATAAVNGYNSAAQKGQTFSFDEVHNINKEEPSGGGGSLMDTSVQVEETEGLLSKLRDFLGNFFAPFKEAWDSQGVDVTEAFKYALASILILLGSIGLSFSNVWSNGTGYQVCSEILSILESILNTIGNIATGLNDAWNFNNTGTQIIQDMFNILLNVLDAIDRIAEATEVWSAGLDFTPALVAFEGLLSAIEPLTSTACDGLVWMYENVLLPFGAWTIEDAMPAFFELLAAAIGLVNSVLEVFEPLGTWLWESFLQPIAEWSGGVICEVLTILAELLTAIGEWISEHQTVIETLVIIVGSLAIAINLVNAAITIWNGVAAIAATLTTLLSSGASILAGAIAFLTSPIALVIAAITALIAAGVLLYKNWDVVKEKASQIWNGLKDTITNVVNAILNVIETMINGVVAGVNAVIETLNGLSIDIPAWVPKFGGQTFGFNIKPISSVSLPRLAKGGVVSSATALIAGEAGKEAIVPLENNTGWLEMVASRLAESINGIFANYGSAEGYGDYELTIPITLELDGESLLKKLIKIRKRKGYPIVVEETGV